MATLVRAVVGAPHGPTALGTSRTQRSHALAAASRLAGPVRTLAVASGRVFSGSYDKTVRAWDVETLQCLGVLEGHKARTPVYSPSSSPIEKLPALPARPAHQSPVFSPKTVIAQVDDPLPSPRPRSPQEAVRALVSARGHLFSGSDDTTVRVWNASTLQLVKLLDGHNDNVRVLTVDDRFLFSGSWDKTIRVWDMNKDYQCVKARCPLGTPPHRLTYAHPALFMM